MPHHAVVYRAPQTRVGNALWALAHTQVVRVLLRLVTIFVGALIILNLCFVRTEAGRKRFPWLVIRVPFLAKLILGTLGITEGIVPLLLLLILAEIVWRLTA